MVSEPNTEPPRRVDCEIPHSSQSSKRIISVSGRLELLQMVSEPNTETSKRVDYEILHFLNVTDVGLTFLF